MYKKFIYGIFVSLLIASCGDDKSEGEFYMTPSCEEGQYFDGMLGACASDVMPLEFPASFRSGKNEHAFRDEAFDTRSDRIENFITAYAATHLPDYTISSVACTPAFEFDTEYNSAFYDGRFSINCGFKLEKGGKSVINYVFDEKKDKAEYIKILQNPVDNSVSMKLCTVGKTKRDKYTVSGETIKVDEEEIVTTVKCKEFGTTKFRSTAIKSDDPKLEAFPQTLNKFLRNKQSQALVTAGTPVLSYAADRIADLNKLTINCGNSNFDFDITLKPDVFSTVSGIAEIANFDYEKFFVEKPLATESGTPYVQYRSFLGCSTVECFEKKLKQDITYRFFGNNIVLGDLETWSIEVGGTVETSYLAKDAENTDSVCRFHYRLK